MKIRLLSAVLLMFVVLGSVSAQSQMDQEKTSQQPANSSAALSLPPAMPMMIPSSQPAIQTFTDGSIVILVGNRLMKYDKDFNLVKDITLMERTQQNNPRS